MRPVAISLALLISGCGSTALTPATPMAEILLAPTQFEGKRLKVTGVVEGVTKLPLVAEQFFFLRDGTNRIAVVAYGPLPAEGSRTSIVGIVSSAAIIGGQSVGVHVTVGTPPQTDRQ